MRNGRGGWYGVIAETMNTAEHMQSREPTPTICAKNANGWNTRNTSSESGGKNMAARPNLEDQLVFCTYHACRLLPIRCVQFQLLADIYRGTYDTYNGGATWPTDQAIRYSACMDCQEGKARRTPEIEALAREDLGPIKGPSNWSMHFGRTATRESVSQAWNRKRKVSQMEHYAAHRPGGKRRYFECEALRAGFASEEAYLRYLYGSCGNSDKVGRIIGASGNAVRRRMKDLGIQNNAKYAEIARARR